MARKGRKTRWRKLPIPIGNNQGEASCAPHHVQNNLEPEHPSSPSPKEQVSRVTFNEDEYTKITTPRQDMLFKKGYLSKKRPQPQPEQHTSYTSPEPSHSPSESMESEQFIGCDEAAPYPPPFVYPPGYMDPNSLFYLNGGGSYEVYDPYTNSVTVIVGPGAGYPGQPVLATIPCHPVPLQPIEWFQPPPQHQPPNFKKRNSTDSQNWGSSQSCESPSSGQELEAQDSSLFYPQPQYIYPGYMFGAPMYNINGVNVQGAVPPPPQHQPQPADQPKRRKKRRKRRRPGMGDEDSESSCEEVAGSGVSSDAGQGSSCSKTTDSGIHTGADSPQPIAPVSPVNAHSLPQPEVSTEEEPSQPSTDHLISLESATHHTTTTPTPTDSSTEDESGKEPHDTSVKELITKTENISLVQSTNERLQEQDIKEQDIKELEEEPEEVLTQESLEFEAIDEFLEEEIINCVAQEDELLTEIERNEISKIKREESDEWVNAKEDGSENEEDTACLVESIECIEKDEKVVVYAEEAIQPEKIDDTIQLDDVPKEEIEECIAEETGYSEEGWGSAEETSMEERWAMAELGEEVTVDKPITEAVTRWLESQGTKVLVPLQPIESEDEGIGEETSSITGPKNVKGNPFLVQYPSMGTRVADSTNCESQSGAWRAKCDPMVSVDRYYRLGADLPHHSSATFKTATGSPIIMHLDPSSPFPCGLVCCILQ